MGKRDVVEETSTPLREGSSFDAALRTEQILEIGWPLLENLKGDTPVEIFEEQFKARFPDAELLPFGGSVFDFIVGNVRNAVLNEIVTRLLEEERTLELCSEQSAFKSVPARDWRVARARVLDDVSVVRRMIQ